MFLSHFHFFSHFHFCEFERECPRAQGLVREARVSQRHDLETPVQWGGGIGAAQS